MIARWIFGFEMVNSQLSATRQSQQANKREWNNCLLNSLNSKFLKYEIRAKKARKSALEGTKKIKTERNGNTTVRRIFLSLTLLAKGDKHGTCLPIFDWLFSSHEHDYLILIFQWFISAGYNTI